jgi:hypothetical protein
MITENGKYIIEFPCPRCRGWLYSAHHASYAFGAYHFFVSKYICFNCGRLFEVDPEKGIVQIPDREEPLPYLEIWQKKVIPKRKPLKK